MRRRIVSQMMVPDAIERRVLAEIDRRFDGTLEFLREMVRQPSVLGQEKGVQELIFDRLSALGLNPEIWDLDLDVLRKHPAFGKLDIGYEDRPNVTARWAAGQPGGRSVIFNGHIDVVSPEPLANWSYDPWAAVVDGDWLYGRGAGDMKAGVAAMLLAVEAVQATGVRLKGDVILETVIEEECTGNGTLACGLRGLRADAAIVPESHGLRASLATVGVIWFRVHTRGSASHVLAADSAVNAIEETYKVIAALRQLEAELNAGERHPLYRDLPHPINLNVGIIRAGDWPSTVPSACTLECRLSCQPGVTVDETQARVRETIAAAAESDPWLRENPPEVEFFGFRAEPSVVDPDAAAMRALAECHASIVGTPLNFRPGTATTDQRFFLDYWDMPATSYGPTAENIHAGNERVLIPSIAETARVLALYLLRWCGVAD
jgi:acetylornithine deacetylase